MVCRGNLAIEFPPLGKILPSRPVKARPRVFPLHHQGFDTSGQPPRNPHNVAWPENNALPCDQEFEETPTNECRFILTQVRVREDTRCVSGKYVRLEEAPCTVCVLGSGEHGDDVPMNLESL
jgi:hypothetical protein